MFLLRYAIIHVLWIVSIEADKVNNPLGNIRNDLTSSDPIIQELVRRVEVLEARDSSHVQVLEERDRSHVQVLKELERSHRKENDAIHQELSIQKAEIKRLRLKSIGQDRLLTRLLRRNNLYSWSSPPVAKDNEDEGQKIDVQSNDNRIRRAENEVTVAFTAGLTHIFDHAGIRQNIVFDHVETNLGNGYNAHHGVFTAPVSGLYVFYTSILADKDREVWCRIVVNGNKKASMNARGTNGRYDQGSQAIVVQLQQGDDVSVQNAAVDDSIYGDADIYSTFSGFLLQQDVSQAGTIVG